MSHSWENDRFVVYSKKEIDNAEKEDALYMIEYLEEAIRTTESQHRCMDAGNNNPSEFYDKYLKALKRDILYIKDTHLII
jgi:hypothetical protein